ncbi:MAG: hypothetical protein FWF05_09440 [Oscillospiraceae bacterium]|nr:hypothetical protein [Oscillospiraceae bacterium]
MKKILLLVLALLLALSMAACGGGGDKDGENQPNGDGENIDADSNNGDNNNGNDNGDIIGDGLFEFSEDFLKNSLQGDYHIIYKATTYGDGESESLTMEQIKTSKGYYYKSNDDSGKLFIKNGEAYDAYEEYDGVFENTEMQYSQMMVDIMMVGITGYMNTYSAFSSQLKKSGSQTVAGRSCTEYKFDYSMPGVGKVKYVYCIDKETGVCLKFSVDAAGSVLSGHQKVGYEFECTKFQTSGVSLPAYN